MASEIGRRHEGFEIAGALRGVGKTAWKTDDRKAGSREAVVQHSPRSLVAVSGKRDSEIFRHRVVADDEQRAGPAIAADEVEIAGGILAVERVQEQDPACIGMTGQTLQRLSRSLCVGAKGEVGNVTAGPHGRTHRFGIGDPGCVERTIEIAHARQGPSGLGMPQQIQLAHRPLACAKHRNSSKGAARLAMRKALRTMAGTLQTQRIIREFGRALHANDAAHTILPDINNCVKLSSIALVPHSVREYIGAKIGAVWVSRMNDIVTADYVPSEDEPFMNERQKSYFRLKLVTWKNDILREARETLEILQQENANHPDLADRASSETDRAIELRARDRQRKLISKIDSALQRIDEGTYGYCEETGEPIALKRLDARPIATLSIEAQERHERREKVYRDD